ncbi:large ribosomal subunit protein mL62-like [Haemaphysalis longicornis]
MHGLYMAAMRPCRLILRRSGVGNALIYGSQFSTGSRTTEPTEPGQETKDQEEAFLGIPSGALSISCCRSSGPGGQNVNKVNSKVEIRFHLESAAWIPTEGRHRIRSQWGHLVNKQGDLVLTCDERRSQEANKRLCLDRLRALVEEACQPPSPSVPDAATQQRHAERQARAAARRIEEKRARSRWRRQNEPSSLH